MSSSESSSLGGREPEYDTVPILDDQDDDQDVQDQEAPQEQVDESFQEPPCCYCFIDPNALCHRIIALALMCTLGFGSYFCYDNPGALQDEIKSAMDITTYQFENLYAFYSWPNVFLPILGGYLLDNVFGIRLGAVIFAGFICIGTPTASAKIIIFSYEVKLALCVQSAVARALLFTVSCCAYAFVYTRLHTLHT
jgi:hypothetical protein